MSVKKNSIEIFRRIYGSPTNIEAVWEDRDELYDSINRQVIEALNYDERRTMADRAAFDLECG